jgi:hypothetical protein
MEHRDFIDIDINRSHLVEFMKQAAAGHYYRPMDAVGRLARLEIAATSLTPNSVLGVLARELRELRASLGGRGRKPTGTSAERITLRTLIGTKRKELRTLFIESGGTLDQWATLLNTAAASGLDEDTTDWTISDWLAYFMQRVGRATQQASEAVPKAPAASEQGSSVPGSEGVS